jgi:hypothetical protein
MFVVVELAWFFLTRPLNERGGVCAFDEDSKRVSQAGSSRLWHPILLLRILRRCARICAYAEAFSLFPFRNP